MSLSKTLTQNLRRRPALPIPANLLQKSSLISTSAPAASAEPQQQDRRQRSTWSKLLLFVPGAITFGLGTWQIIRRQEKIKKLEYQQSRLRDEPLKGNEIGPASGSLDSLKFRRVQCRGVFDEKKSIYIGPRSRSISGVTENGYYLITPLVPVLDDPKSVGSPVLVNRGWVPRSWRDKALDASEEKPSSSSLSISTQGTDESPRKSWWRFWSSKEETLEHHHPSVDAVEVTGVIRDSEKPSIFVPANDPDAAQWFYVDVPAIARACGLPEKTLYIEDINDKINPSNPYPIPKDVSTLIRSSVMPQDHLNYTITWYSLSAAVTFMAIKRLKSQR
ncbi:surfeit locus protein 1 [Andrographis paniculata]|uniref:surfeit locus protein 1 n=1 Tax=Andrographis paniculata TaxID=175694 RepID=UPI0021E75C24|nr:surfeit locus protein 1 [Andrographis paniculata]